MRKPAADGGGGSGPESRGTQRRAADPGTRSARDRWRSPSYIGLLRMPSLSPHIRMSDRPFTGNLLWVPFPGLWSERVLHMLLGRRRVERLRYVPPR